MPAFRRREEGESRSRRPPAGARRREAEEEEAEGEAEPVRGGFRRPPGSSPWQRGWTPEPGQRPVAPPRGRESWVQRLVEVAVPRAEREDPFFKYGAAFQILSRFPAAAARPEAGPRREAPPPSPQARRAARARGGPPTVDPRNWFDDRAIYQAALQVRTDPRFARGVPVALVQVAPASANDAQRAADLIRFFGIPKTEVERHNAQTIWTELLYPFLDELSYALDVGKPAELPGSFGFQVSDNPKQPQLRGSFWLGYSE